MVEEDVVYMEPAKKTQKSWIFPLVWSNGADRIPVWQKACWENNDLIVDNTPCEMHYIICSPFTLFKTLTYEGIEFNW